MRIGTRAYKKDLPTTAANTEITELRQKKSHTFFSWAGLKEWLRMGLEHARRAFFVQVRCYPGKRNHSARPFSLGNETCIAYYTTPCVKNPSKKVEKKVLKYTEADESRRKYTKQQALPVVIEVGLLYALQGGKKISAKGVCTKSICRCTGRD